MKAKLDKLNSNVTFTLTTMGAQSHLFDQYLKDQQQKVATFQPEYTRLMMQLEMAQRELRIAQKSRDERDDLAVELLREIAFRVKIDLKSDYKRYFPEKFSVVVRKSESLLKAFQHIERVLADEKMESITAFKDDVALTYQSLIDANNLVANSESNEKIIQGALKQLYHNWGVAYQRLKWFIRGYFHGGDVDYQIFFKDQPPKRRYKTKTEESLSEEVVTTAKKSVTTP